MNGGEPECGKPECRARGTLAGRTGGVVSRRQSWKTHAKWNKVSFINASMIKNTWLSPRECNEGSACRSARIERDVCSQAQLHLSLYRLSSRRHPRRGCILDFAESHSLGVVVVRRPLGNHSSIQSHCASSAHTRAAVACTYVSSADNET